MDIRHDGVESVEVVSSRSKPNYFEINEKTSTGSRMTLRVYIDQGNKISKCRQKKPLQTLEGLENSTYGLKR